MQCRKREKKKKTNSMTTLLGKKTAVNLIFHFIGLMKEVFDKKNVSDWLYDLACMPIFAPDQSLYFHCTLSLVNI